MNPTEDNLNRMQDDAVLELLVDGELDEARRRELLLRLEREPDGWRRCAMSFLEAQSLEETLGPLGRSIVAPAASAAPIPPAAKPPSRQRWQQGRGGTLLAMAVSFLVALVLGTLLRDFAAQRRSPTGDRSEVAGREGGDRSRSEDPQAKPNWQPETRPWQDRSGGPWQLVNLGTDGDGESIQLPARQRDAMDEAWFDRFPQAMPEDVKQALRRTGHRVDQSRQYVPMRMKDGRQLVVPVDQFDVHYVGNQPYQ